MIELLMFVTAGLLLVMIGFMMTNYVSHRLYPIKIENSSDRERIAAGFVRQRERQREKQCFDIR
jgi:hypothetical protein